MNPCKPLYPPPWWATPEPPPSCRTNDALPFGEEFIVRFVGTDCDGNALYCVRRRRPPCEPRTCGAQPRPWPSR